MLKREELHPVVVLLPGQVLEARGRRPGARGQDRRAERGHVPLLLACPRLLKLEELHLVLVVLPARGRRPGGRG